MRTRGTTFWQLGLASVKNQMSKSVGHRLIDGVIKLIQLDRTDEKKQNRDLIAKLIHVMLALDFYKELFEPRFLEVTKDFFKENAAQNFKQLNVSSHVANLNFYDLSSFQVI